MKKGELPAEPEMRTDSKSQPKSATYGKKVPTKASVKDTNAFTANDIEEDEFFENDDESSEEDSDS